MEMILSNKMIFAAGVSLAITLIAMLYGKIKESRSIEKINILAENSYMYFFDDEQLNNRTGEEFKEFFLNRIFENKLHNCVKRCQIHVIDENICDIDYDIEATLRVKKNVVLRFDKSE